MRRVSIVGTPGSGKTTLGRQLAAAIGVPYVELDSIFHQPGWRQLAAHELHEQVRREVAADAWVIDGNYSATRDLVWQRADTVVWLDLPRRLVMRRVICRTFRRALTRERLWNGNREPLSNLYRLDREENIIRWAWTKHADYAPRYTAAMLEAHAGGPRWIRLRSPQGVDDFLAGLAR